MTCGTSTVGSACVFMSIRAEQEQPYLPERPVLCVGSKYNRRNLDTRILMAAGVVLRGALFLLVFRSQRATAGETAHALRFHLKMSTFP